MGAEFVVALVSMLVCAPYIHPGGLHSEACASITHAYNWPQLTTTHVRQRAMRREKSCGSQTTDNYNLLLFVHLLQLQANCAFKSSWNSSNIGELIEHRSTCDTFVLPINRVPREPCSFWSRPPTSVSCGCARDITIATCSSCKSKMLSLAAHSKTATSWEGGNGRTRPLPRTPIAQCHLTSLCLMLLLCIA